MVMSAVALRLVVVMVICIGIQELLFPATPIKVVNDCKSSSDGNGNGDRDRNDTCIDDDYQIISNVTNDSDGHNCDNENDNEDNDIR